MYIFWRQVPTNENRLLIFVSIGSFCCCCYLAEDELKRKIEMKGGNAKIRNRKNWVFRVCMCVRTRVQSERSEFQIFLSLDRIFSYIKIYFSHLILFYSLVRTTTLSSINKHTHTYSDTSLPYIVYNNITTLYFHLDLQLYTMALKFFVSRCFSSSLF